MWRRATLPVILYFCNSLCDWVNTVIDGTAKTFEMVKDLSVCISAHPCLANVRVRRLEARGQDMSLIDAAAYGPLNSRLLRKMLAPSLVTGDFLWIVNTEEKCGSTWATDGMRKPSLKHFDQWRMSRYLQKYDNCRRRS